MLKLLLSISFFIIFLTKGLCQVREIVDNAVDSIQYVPYGNFLVEDAKSKRKNKVFRVKNANYHRVLLLDTTAIPYLIEKIGDTTNTNIHVPCSPYALKRGDVAFALLNDIIWIPWSAVTGSQWDSFSCDALPDGAWDYLRNQRLRFQKELHDFFGSRKGEIWLKLFKEKLEKKERDALTKELEKLLDR
jgi:hypothetical protein